MNTDRAFRIHCRLFPVLFAGIAALILSGCGSREVIGEVYGSEHEYISIGEDTYTQCNNPGVNIAWDKKEQLGIVAFRDVDTDPMEVYSIKGYDDNEYIYAIWVYDGAFYKKDPQ